MRREACVALFAALICIAPQLVAAERKAARVYNGAIAYHRDSSSYGYAIDRNTAREAQIEALRQCRHPECEVVVRLRNNCGAVANGPQRFFTGTGATREEAQTKAMRACGATCELAAWACTR
jgi:hypothetical protein